MPLFIGKILAWIAALFSRSFMIFRSQMAAVKTSIIAWFVFTLGYGLAAIIKHALIALGIGFVTYNLGSFALDTIYERLQESLTDLPSDALMFLKLAKVDEGFSILFGALSGRLTMMGLRAAKMRQGRVFYA